MKLVNVEDLKVLVAVESKGEIRYGKLVTDLFDDIPTVEAISIDKPFLKMRYGDYVIYNKKWLVNHLQTEWNILQGKEYQPAIPVEWIEQWVDQKTGTKVGDEIGYLEEDKKMLIGFIYWLLGDWEKENEID